jgi:hypothetical protein
MAPDYLLRHARPWITFDAQDWLDARAWHGATVFEYGSGGSTLYWHARGARCISVEHDPAWFAKVQKHAAGKAGIDLRLIPPDGETGEPRDPALPGNYATADEALRDHTFRAYITSIDEFADGSLDAVIVDGRARPSAIVHGAPKVKPGGILLLDNSDRAYYRQHTAHILQGMEELRFPGVAPALTEFSTTSIFVRPA